MNNWEQEDSDWKEDEKPWEGLDAWKLEEDLPINNEITKNPKILRSLEVSQAIRPTVEISVVQNLGDIKVADKDSLKEVAKVSNLQKASLDNGDVYQYSTSRNLWIKIPWKAWGLG